MNLTLSDFTSFLQCNKKVRQKAMCSRAYKTGGCQVQSTSPNDLKGLINSITAFDKWFNPKIIFLWIISRCKTENLLVN